MVIKKQKPILTTEQKVAGAAATAVVAAVGVALASASRRVRQVHGRVTGTLRWKDETPNVPCADCMDCLSALALVGAWFTVGLSLAVCLFTVPLSWSLRRSARKATWRRRFTHRKYFVVVVVTEQDEASYGRIRKGAKDSFNSHDVLPMDDDEAVESTMLVQNGDWLDPRLQHFIGDRQRVSLTLRRRRDGKTTDLGTVDVHALTLFDQKNYDSLLDRFNAVELIPGDIVWLKTNKLNVDGVRIP